MASLTSKVSLQNLNELPINPATEEKQDDLKAEMQKLIGFEIPKYDYIALTYVSGGDANNEIETVVYRQGGSGGTIVCTLTLGYTGSNLTAITKT